jgi:hypothetical protein
MDPNPFAVLSLIVAPAILTNASTVLIMSTSNRLARAVDRARELSRQLEDTTDQQCREVKRRLSELSAAEERTLLMLQALRSFYLALGGFAIAAIISLLGAASVPLGISTIIVPLELAGVAAGVIAVSALVLGSVKLLRETRIAVQVITERAEHIRERFREKESISKL